MKRVVFSVLALILVLLPLKAQNIFNDGKVFIDKIEKGSYKISYNDGPNYSSVYVIEGSERALVIDAGDKADYDLLSLVGKCTDKPFVLALTHTHGDHLGAVAQFSELYVNPKESMQALSRYQGKILEMTDGYVFDLGGKFVQALEITGHTTGGMVFCDYQTGNCYCGDCFGTGQVWLQMNRSETVISDYLKEVEKMLGYVKDRHITHFYTGHFGQEDCVYGVNYIQDMALLARNMLKGDYTSVHHNRSAETANTQMTSLRRATIVFNPQRVK